MMRLASLTRKPMFCPNACADTIPLRIVAAMFSHVVIFWTQPDIPNATEQLLAGAEKYLKPCPGVLHYHCGQMAGSHRDVVDQSYQVALNLVFEDRAAQDAYQTHPLHVEFVEKIFKTCCERVVVYDFEN